MTPVTTETWIEANQQYLAAALAAVRETLVRQIARRNGTTGTSESAGAPPEADPSVRTSFALDRLCELFSLTPFERNLLLLCAAVELDSGIERLCADAQGDVARPYPTFSLALAAFPGAHWDALSPMRPLRRWRLIDPGPGDVVTLCPLRIDERVLHFLVGIPCSDTRLLSVTWPAHPPDVLPPTHRAIADRIVECWERSGAASPVLHLGGECDIEKEDVSACAAASLGLRLAVLHAADLPAGAGEREVQARLWEREAALSGSVLLVVLEAEAQSHAASAFIESVQGTIVVASREALRLRNRPVVRLDVERPTVAEQYDLWRESLGPAAARLDGEIARVVSQFTLGPRAIRAAGEQARQGQAGRSADAADHLWDACRLQTRARLDNLAQRIQPAATWHDLVLPEAPMQQLREIAAQVRNRATVYETWGFAARSTRGLGISALFAGPSGTGKTLAAEILANDLRLDLYRLDLSQVVSKYIGETEKNLKRVFDAAEEGGAVLLFDEADALFGKRSEVKDSHDRYANIEVSYLLQRMESYRGLAILTTNLKGALDAAFLRRLRFVVTFPFPDAAQRAEIWRRVIPSDTPTDRLDIERLSRLNVAGGNICNIALSAAFLAANAAEPLRMNHLLHAARSEYAKLEKPLIDAEVKGWV